MTITGNEIVGDVRMNGPQDEDRYKAFIIALTELMIEHRVDKIDVGWSRGGILNILKQEQT